VTFVMPMTLWLTSPATTVYGGALAMLADVAMSVAVGHTTPARTAHSPLDLKVNFLRPVFADGRDLVARAHVTHRGRSLAVASCEISNADGKAVVLATASSIILPDRPWTGGAAIVPADETPADEEEEVPER
jgi:uncharacterized protein (TIGR00369 family)